MKILFFVIGINFGCTNLCFSQNLPAPMQLEPSNGSNGIAGSYSNSYLIKWDSVPNATYYEFVASDNHLCFNGCPGDTRTGKPGNTSAIIYNLPSNKWYYWIVRAYLNNGDTTNSSGIWSFRTVTSGNENPYITVSIDPLTDKINIGVEWVVEPDVQKIAYSVYTELGQEVIAEGKITLIRNEFIRQEWFPISSVALNPGTYLFKFTKDKNNQQIIIKVVVV